MAAALNRQLKADKEAERARQDKADQERLHREETLRELTIKYRRRCVGRKITGKPLKTGIFVYN